MPGDDGAFQHHIACFRGTGRRGTTRSPCATPYTFVFRWVRGVRAYDPL